MPAKRKSAPKLKQKQRQKQSQNVKVIVNQPTKRVYSRAPKKSTPQQFPTFLSSQPSIIYVPGAPQTHTETRIIETAAVKPKLTSTETQTIATKPKSVSSETQTGEHQLPQFVTYENLDVGIPVMSEPKTVYVRPKKDISQTTTIRRPTLLPETESEQMSQMYIRIPKRRSVPPSQEEQPIFTPIEEQPQTIPIAEKLPFAEELKGFRGQNNSLGISDKDYNNLSQQEKDEYNLIIQSREIPIEHPNKERFRNMSKTEVEQYAKPFLGLSDSKLKSMSKKTIIQLLNIRGL